jgi:hypothetical protein
MQVRRKIERAEVTWRTGRAFGAINNFMGPSFGKYF